MQHENKIDQKKSLERKKDSEKVEKIEKKVSVKIDEQEEKQVEESESTASVNLVPNKVVLQEKFKFEVPLAGRPDVFINVYFQEKQEVTDPRMIKHLLAANAPINY